MMNFGLKSMFAVEVTVIANEFIDKYMAAANGEYVKVYLYLLRHDGEPVTVSSIADALNHTEADVKRALSYWERAGVLRRGDAADQAGSGGQRAAGAPVDGRDLGAAGMISGGQSLEAAGMRSAGRDLGAAGMSTGGPRDLGEAGMSSGGLNLGAVGMRSAGRDLGQAGMQSDDRELGAVGASSDGRDLGQAGTPSGGRGHGDSGISAGDVSLYGSGDQKAAAAQTTSRRKDAPGTTDASFSSGTGAMPVKEQADRPAAQIPPQPADSAERMQKLSKDEEFATLLYAAQQYLGKMFTTIECEKFAYFYDILKMSGELLEYLAEYCAQNGHTSIRYIEKVALNWYQQGIRTKSEAREYTMRFSTDINCVMKAFGLTNRSPGTAEREIIKKWFHTYGFDRQLVTEACNRTIKATQTPSFQYADKILAGWKENGVKTMADVEELDKKRQLAKGQSKEREPAKKSSSPNRFRNFEERNYNYDEAIWDDIRKRYKKGGSGDGTE